MTKNDGGPAFPYVDATAGPWPGMSLRDWFAGMATEGDIKHHRGPSYSQGGAAAYNHTREEARYLHADAMLEARENE